MTYRFAALYKHYGRMGAGIISVPAAFTQVTGKAHWQVLLQARAIETSLYVIAARSRRYARKWPQGPGAIA